MTNSELGHVLTALPMPAMLIGPQERVVAANPAAHVLLGRGLEGRHYITALRQPGILDAVERVIASAEPQRALYLAAEGARDTTWEARAAPVLSGVLVTFTDRTEVEEAGQMRRDFVANVSHELRTPLTALLGFIETLRGAARDDDAARGRFLAMMEQEATRMNRLVRDLLSLSRVEAAERLRPTDRVDVAGILTSVVSGLSRMAEEAGARIHLHVEPAAQDAPVPGDAEQLSQVFNNLIENAIKYGGGQVRITCVQEPMSSVLRAPAIRVDVSDDGDGVDPAHIPRLTERFYRVDSHRSREIGGTGLGLAIVKHIVGRHRGRLRIASEPGQGSTFSIYLAYS